MIRTIVALVLVVLSPVRSGDGAGDPVERARALLKLYLEGRHAEFADAGTQEVKGALRPAQLESISAAIEAQIGAYREERSAERSKGGGVETVTFVLAHERGTATFLVAIDSESRLAGFFVTRVAPAAAWSPPSYVSPASFREESVTVGAAPFQLPGILTLPNGKDRAPAVVLVHGSGPNDADETVLSNKPFKDLAHGLGSRGIAVLRYEKRTLRHGAALAAKGTITLDEETIDDAVAAAALLRTRSEIDPARVFVAGHSLGATAAPFVARKDDRLRGLVLLAGTPRSALTLVAEQMKHVAGLDGEVSAAERAEIEKFERTAAEIRAGKKEAVESNLLGAPGSYWLAFETLDAAGAARSLSIPMLFLQGGRDYQVTQECFTAWKTALAGRDNATFRLFPRLNHLFVAGEGPSGPAEYGVPGHVDEEVVRAIADFVSGLR